MAVDQYKDFEGNRLAFRWRREHTFVLPSQADNVAEYNQDTVRYEVWLLNLL